MTPSMTPFASTALPLEPLLTTRFVSILADLDRSDVPPAEVTVSAAVGDWSVVAAVAHYSTFPPPPGGWDTDARTDADGDPGKVAASAK